MPVPKDPKKYELWRSRLSKALKGRTVWNKGKKGVQQCYRKGMTFEEAFGVERAKEMKTKMSNFHKGKHHSPATEFKKGSKSNTGRKFGPMSEIHKAKISEAMKGKMPKNYQILRTPYYVKKSLRSRKPTSLEKTFQGIINKHNLPYKYVGDGKIFIERYNPDFINTNGEKIAIEVYARYYKKRHNRDIKEWQKKRGETFEKYGWRIIYFNEIEVNEEYVLNTLKGDD